MTVLPLYNTAVRNLERVRNPKQARKLLFAACRKRWENDEAKLETIALGELVGELQQFYPTLEALRAVLARIVSKLNKKEVYAEVADEVLQALGCLYGNAEVDQIRPIAPPTGPVDTDAFEPTQLSGLTAVAHTLEAHPQAKRMRKLLYAACYNFWENDLDKLLTLDFQALIEQVRQSYPSHAQLQGRLQRVVGSLNKKAQYEQISGEILKQLDRLYTKEAEIGVSSLPAIPEPATAIPAAPPPAEPLPRRPAAVVPPVEEGGETRQESVDRFYNAYKLRRDVMTHTTPLRAKALLFSTLHGKPLETHGVDWLLLKTYNLDDLLRDLIAAYSTLSDLQAALERSARGHENRIRTDEALQAASAIVLSVKSIYGRTEGQRV